jgi:CDP-diacylglycerol--glycerol-3-phosphate 3-phosphatidyltransferase
VNEPAAGSVDPVGMADQPVATPIGDAMGDKVGDRVGDPVALPAVPGVSIWNIANALTFVRLLLVPVFAVLLLHDGGQQGGWRVAATVVFGVASLTDRFDGELARRRGLITDLGKIVDPIADKALIGMALIGLSWLDELSWWVTAVVLVRELGVTALRFVVIRHGVIPASRGGKLKTLLQALAIGLYLLPLHGDWTVLASVVMAAAVVVTVVTGADYVARAMTLRRTSERAQRKRADRSGRAGGQR